MLAFAVAAERASACVCAQDHPAGRLAFAPAAIVGVVEEADGGNHVIRVERAVKGDLAGRVTVTSQLTSCQALLEKGARVGLILGGEPGAWDLIQCNVFDPDALIAAGALPPPSGATRFIAAVQAEGLDAVALGARGGPAGYGLPNGTPLAVAGCGDGVVQAMRRDGKVHVFTRAARGLVASVTSEVPVREVLALGCVGDTTWVVGRDELVSVRPGEPARIRMDRRPATAAAIVGSRAYIAHGDLLRVYPLKGSGSLRATRYDGVFVQLSVRGNRVAGRLRDGRGAVLDLASGRQRTAAISGSLAWFSGNRLVDSGAVRDARLRVVRRVTTSGHLLAVEKGAAYFGDGDVIRRLAPGARRAATFAHLPGNVVAMTPAKATATASGTRVNRVPICP